jgi:hypothetical protein
VVPFEVLFQFGAFDETGLTTFRGTDVRADVLVPPPVVLQVPPFFVIGPTVRDLALEWPFARMNSFVLYDTGGVYRLAALLEPAENFSVLEPLPLRGPALANRSRWWWAGSL